MNNMSEIKKLRNDPLVMWGYQPYEETFSEKLACWGARSVIIAAVAIVFYLFVMLGFAALEREQSFNDEIRAERCAKMGEHIPKRMEHYCDGLGV